MFRVIRFPMIFLAIWFSLTSSGLLMAHNYLDVLKPSGQPPERPYEIHLLAGARQPESGITAGDRSLLAEQGEIARAKGNAKLHVLIQLYEIPSEEQMQALHKRGIELLEYIPYYTWVAAVPTDDPAQLMEIPLVRWIGAWSALDKLHPYIRQDAWDSYAIHPTEDKVMAMVLLHDDVALERGPILAAAHDGVAMPPIEGIHGMTMWLPKANLLDLAAEEEVAWIEEGDAPLFPNNDGVRGSMQVDPLYSAPYSLSGSGVRVFVFDGGTVRTTHNMFNPGSRVTVIDGGTMADHPTHVAGTVGGDGDGTRAKGVAPNVTIYSAEYDQTGGTMLFWDNSGDIEADYALARNTYNIDMGTNSIGSNTASNNYACAREGDYGVSSNMLDGIVRGDNASVGSPVIMTWANGNERTGGSPRGRCGSNYVTTAPPSCAKNPIHIGAINSDYDSMTSFSSWGPCDDGRLKPIVVASGCELGRVSGEAYIYSSLSTGDSNYGGSGWCGTSMATPAAAGVVSLMIEQWRTSGYGGANERPLPALVKAMLMHTARDLGQDGPDYIYGYGEIDAKAAVDLIRNGAGLASAGVEHWGSGSISSGATNSYTFTLPPEMGEFKISLAWDDRAAAAYSAVALINDLDLEIVAPDATIYRPFVLNQASPYLAATTAVNTKDNQEQVIITNPASGTWTIRVKGTTVPYGPQTYGLVFSASYPKYDATTCSELVTNGTFETNTTGWTLSSGPARAAAPAGGHGSYSLRLGNTASSTHTAYTTVSIPSGVKRAELSFYWYMTSNEGTYGYGWDVFYAEVYNNSGTRLATFDYRSDGWQENQWMKSENIDLTPWAGQTVRVQFTAVNDSSLTTAFYVDDISVQTCAAPAKSWWIGRTTTSSSTSNWSNDTLPSCSTDTVIPYPVLGGNYPSIAANLDVNNLSIASSAQLNMAANYTLGVCGNWSNDGAFNATSGSVEFKGSSGQTIGGLSNTTYNNLTINNANGVSLSQNTSANGALTLTNGRLTLGSYHLTMGQASSFAGAFSSSAMIVPTGSGQLRRIINGANPAAITFPIGDNTATAEYSPATLDFSSVVGYSGSSYVAVRLSNSLHTQQGPQPRLLRYWTVTQSGLTSFSCAATFTYVDADLDLGSFSETAIYGRKWDTSWTVFGAVNAGANSFSMNVSSFSDFTGGVQSPTAVLLARLETIPLPGQIEIIWETISEVGNLGFNLYRSESPGGPLTKLNAALIPSKSPGGLLGAAYSFIDTSAAPGVLYYYWLEFVGLEGNIIEGPASAAANWPLFLPLLKR